MKLAILHYHLNRGGVTRVIENQLVALDAVLEGSPPWEVAVLYGGRRRGWNESLAGRLRNIRLTLCEVPRLDYDSVSRGEDSPSARPGPAGSEALYQQVIGALDELAFRPPETLLHVHNHSLGKNRALPVVVSQLAEAGFALVLQIHDFAEDYRPTNYRYLGELVRGPLYPQAPSIHYAALTSRDFRVLVEAGVPAERAHRLPNPVPVSVEPADRQAARGRLAERFGISPEQRLLLVPVRCIRRKNIGEALLCSLLAPAGTVVGLTLPPLNPAEVSIYRAWKQTAAEADLPCVFELGVPGAMTFPENLAAADGILTTSVAEGFGMVYLESWLAGRLLAGRNLPEVTEDFLQAGVNLDGLWQRLPVPVDWVGAERLRERLIESHRRTLAAYGREPGPEADAQLEEKLAGGWVDFGDLDEPMQRAVIQRAQDRAARGRLTRHSAGLERTLGALDPDRAELLAANARAIHAAYGLVPSGRRLLACYRGVAAGVRGQAVEDLARPERILDRFLSPARFRLIRA